MKYSVYSERHVGGKKKEGEGQTVNVFLTFDFEGCGMADLVAAAAGYKNGLVLAAKAAATDDEIKSGTLEINVKDWMKKHPPTPSATPPTIEDMLGMVKTAEDAKRIQAFLLAQGLL